jgi:hypothetical protein
MMDPEGTIQFSGAWTYIEAHAESGITSPVLLISRADECDRRRLIRNKFDIKARQWKSLRI